MTPCHICGRNGLKAFASTVCFGAEGDPNREKCVDLGRTRLGMNAAWYRTKERFPWMADRQKRRAA